MDLVSEMLTPLNLVLTILIIFLVWLLFGPRRDHEREEDDSPKPRHLPKMKRKDMTVEELAEFDGRADKNDGRILISVNGTIFDVSRGANYYGPGGSYHLMAGRDASRMLATFDLKAPAGPPTYDDLSDLKSSEMDQVREWYLQFKEKYDVVGKLIKAGEKPTEYSDQEEMSESTVDSQSTKN